ncbi:phosphate/phosphite/phosphonate ABC transporter substrate-binding protein [Phenylobacterium sp.]|uniref:phosphate/phosphite/phosphonate ABC transporter substrate-binding protein n=1 Tax=Phenylobacterium sp. TaxID=1871053 RepID=UPI0025FD3C73|nr:phosphate/phosphite/phosphonate ABC transporter substrate-binding protein [Phenylobacterium sp.]
MLRLIALCLAVLLPTVARAAPELGSAQNPLRVVLIPADGGTEDGTRADFQPVFNAVTRTSGLHFTLRVGQSYNAVVEAMCNGAADVAFFGPVAYVQAHKRGCAELLAVSVESGRSTYYAGVFAKARGPVHKLSDLRGRRMAFGDLNSASSFMAQTVMLLDAGIDPARDLGGVRLTGSHANSLAALSQGQADAAALSFESFEKAVNQGVVSPRDISVVARSAPIPNPPLGMSTRLPPALKARLKRAFATVATAPGVTPDMIRGYGGKRVDGYDTKYSERNYAAAAALLARVDDPLKAAILKKAAAR